MKKAVLGFLTAALCMTATPVYAADQNIIGSQVEYSGRNMENFVSSETEELPSVWGITFSGNVTMQGYVREVVTRIAYPVVEGTKIKAT